MSWEQVAKACKASQDYKYRLSLMDFFMHVKSLHNSALQARYKKGILEESIENLSILVPFLGILIHRGY